MSRFAVSATENKSSCTILNVTTAASATASTTNSDGHASAVTYRIALTLAVTSHISQAEDESSGRLVTRCESCQSIKDQRISRDGYPSVLAEDSRQSQHRLVFKMSLRRGQEITTS